MLIIFFEIGETVRKEFILAGQRVNPTYYCEVLRRLRENVRRLRPGLWRKKNWLLHRDKAPSSTSFCAREISTKNTRLALLFPRLKADTGRPPS
jgi:hypothetical protein